MFRLLSHKRQTFTEIKNCSKSLNVRYILTLKSIPTVAIKLPPRNAPSLKRTKTHVFPTAESPSSITCSKATGRETHRDKGLGHPSKTHSLHQEASVVLPTSVTILQYVRYDMSNPELPAACDALPALEEPVQWLMFATL